MAELQAPAAREGERLSGDVRPPRGRARPDRNITVSQDHEGSRVERPPYARGQLL